MGFDYKTKASAASIVGGMHGMHPVGGGAYKGNCPNPMHPGDRNSGDFKVWNDETTGELRFYCGTHQCGDGGDTIGRLAIYAALGWPEWTPDGHTHRRQNGRRPQSEEEYDGEPIVHTPKDSLYFDDSSVVRTVQGLLGATQWFAAVNKQGVGFEQNGKGRRQWLHSSAGADGTRGGDLALVRAGGRQAWKHRTLIAWANHAETARRIAGVEAAGIAWCNVRDDDGGWTQQVAHGSVRPALALSGTEALPAVTAVGVLDVDLDKPPTEEALRLRDHLCAKATAAGMPVFESSGGVGRHILWRGVESGEWVRGKKVAYGLAGIKVEVFPAGTLRHVVLRTDRQVADGSRIPRMRPSSVLELLRSSRFTVDSRWLYETHIREARYA